MASPVLNTIIQNNSQNRYLSMIKNILWKNSEEQNMLTQSEFTRSRELLLIQNYVRSQNHRITK